MRAAFVLVALIVGTWGGVYLLDHFLAATKGLVVVYTFGTAQLILSLARRRTTGRTYTRKGLLLGLFVMMAGITSLLFSLRSGELSPLSLTLYILTGTVLGCLMIAYEKSPWEVARRRRNDERLASLCALQQSNV